MKTRVLIALIGALSLRAAALACGPEMPVPTLADHAAQVVIAEIASVRSYWADEPRRIETELVLEHVEYLKGAYDGAPVTMTLTVPGGTVTGADGEEWGMHLCCAPEYKAGERWVLFVLPTCKVHPVVGMDRGSFRVVQDDAGVERVHMADGRAVAAVSEEGMIRAHTQAVHRPQPSVSAQLGVKLIDPDEAEQGAEERAMSLDDFEAAIAPALARSRDHHLYEQAGRRVPAEHRAVPIKRAGEQTP
ncbi:MAG: hypothetical protein KDA30_15035 [Phycisphaerales bacterium]|nr:hypothetical protein [Phycisphaerales bacterium]